MTSPAISILFLGTLACVALGIILRRLHRLGTPADETHKARTDDGWDIALYRYRPALGDPLRPLEPVVICHGLLSNRFNVDLDERHSVARHLRAVGFDVWVMELRGHGRSVRAATGGLWPFDWTIDDYVQRDLPAVIEYVCRETGANSVHWVGHSLGGMILYAACALGLTGRIRSAVMSDVPADMSLIRSRKLVGVLYGKIVPIIPPFLFIPFVLVLGWISPRLLLPKYGIRSRRTMLRIVANGIVDVGCSRVALHLARVIRRGRFVSWDGTVDYEAGLDRIHFPVIQLAAALRVSPERTARVLIDRAPVEDKTYVRLGRSEGFSEDYNHFTVLLGERAPEEVFPLISDFLKRRSTRAQRDALGQRQP
ncbi:MAG: alpha/beta fold hydrolase [Acidobacteria bacterium]|nr:alpha/beta fold hydrolase [Acidobacteriota bacterium]